MTTTNAVARVRWAMGQSLLPEHLVAQEESLLADAAQRMALSGLPCYGVATLRWREDLLIQGILKLDALLLVLPSGLLLDIDGNARAESFDLNQAGEPHVSVYLHLCRNGDREAGAKPPPTLKTAEGVVCWLWPVALSANPDLAEAQESFRLADFEKGPEGEWALSATYIPPLLQVGTSPFLKAQLGELAPRIEAYRHQLAQEIDTIYLSGENLVNAKLCLKGILRLQGLLANLANEVHLHPFRVLEEIQWTCLDLVVYQNGAIAPLLDPYRHDQLADCFSRVLGPLSEYLQFRQSASPYLPFSRMEGIVRLALPAALKHAREAFLLIQKERVSKPLSLDGLKIAAVSRLPVVHKYALPGIQLSRIERPPFQHSFGPEVEIFELVLGEEWQHAIREAAIGFYADAALAEEKFFLYWR